MVIEVSFICGPYFMFHQTIWIILCSKRKKWLFKWSGPGWIQMAAKNNTESELDDRIVTENCRWVATIPYKNASRFLFHHWWENMTKIIPSQKTMAQLHTKPESNYPHKPIGYCNHYNIAPEQAEKGHNDSWTSLVHLFAEELRRIPVW